jgi:hypothetical protein
MEAVDLPRLLNTSGFPFQLRVEAEISTLTSGNGWSVRSREHQWRHGVSQNSGFIDLVTGYGIVRAVIECKRADSSRWLFLVPGRGDQQQSRARCLCTERGAGGIVFQWADLHVDPFSYEAPFCIGASGSGKERKDRDPMLLERISDDLLQSVEALAVEELMLDRSGRGILFPMVVTAAQLLVATFDPKDTSIETGELPPASAAFSEVSFIRFRKALAHGLPAPLTPILPGPRISDLAASNRDKERTVFVVNSGHIGRFFEAWNVEPMLGDAWPHTILRRQSLP